MVTIRIRSRVNGVLGQNNYSNDKSLPPPPGKWFQNLYQTKNFCFSGASVFRNFTVPVFWCSGPTVDFLFFKCLLPFPFDLNFWTSIYILDFDLYFWTLIYIFGLRSIFLDFDLYFWTSIYTFQFGNMIWFSFYILKLELRFVLWYLQWIISMY